MDYIVSVMPTCKMDLNLTISATRQMFNFLRVNLNQCYMSRST